jgi:hypothetical protein
MKKFSEDGFLRTLEESKYEKENHIDKDYLLNFLVDMISSGNIIISNYGIIIKDDDGNCLLDKNFENHS